MSALSLTYTITNGTTEDATQVNQNFTDIVNYVNSSLIRTDGVAAMTAPLNTNNADPTLDKHAVRKAYVDGAVVVANNGTAQSFTAGVFKTIVLGAKTKDLDNGLAATNYNLATGTFTAPKTGFYLFDIGVFNNAMANSGTIYNSKLNVSGISISGPSVQPSQIGALTDPSVSFSAMWYMTAADTAVLQVKSASTQTQTCANHFMATWLHA